MEKKINANSLFYNVGNRIFYLDVFKLKEICLSVSNNDTREKEITEEYTLDEEAALKLTSKIDHEIKSNNILQNDVILYDVLKQFIDRIMDTETTISDYTEMDLGLSIAFNSLISCGVLKEIS